MLDTPLVSIICLSYNQSQYILESLGSIQNLDYPSIEIIICDDCSKDNSVRVIKDWIDSNRDVHVKFIEHTVNKGICRSVNECLSLSSGKYIQLLALDDILISTKLKRQVEILENTENNFCLVFSDALLMDEYSVLYQNRFIAYQHKYLSLRSGNFYTDLLEGNFIPAMTVLFKREVLNDVGFYDENLSFEDYDMWLRMAVKYDFIFDDMPSAIYRLHSNNTHKKLSDVMRLDSFKILLKHADDKNLQMKLKNEIVYMFLNNKLIGQEKLYFEKFPASILLDKMIVKNRPVLLYKIVNEISKLLS